MPTTPRRTAPIAAAVVTATAALTALVPPAAGAAEPHRSDGRDRTGSVRLDWAACPGKGEDSAQRCAELPVPLDHGDPRGEQITLTVSRIASTGPAARRGTLLLIPGGPGGSGIDRLARFGPDLMAGTRGAYDLVSFDPRGVGLSSPVSCDLDPDDVATVKLRPWPGPGGDISENVARGKRVADACARSEDPVLRSLSSVNEARDIDRVRAALGEERISAWGVSYGAYVGAVYAQLFPHRTDRWLLDSIGDPDHTRVARGWAENYGPAIEDRFPDFAAWASKPRNPLRIAPTPAGVRKEFLRLAARLDREPRPWPGARPPVLDGNVLRQTMMDAFYSDANFPALAELMLAAEDPRKPLPEPEVPPLEVLQNNAAVVVATICNDVRWPRSVPGYAREVAANRVRYPLTAGLPVNIFPCAFWPYEPAEKPVRITSDGPSNILLVQNLRDPSTPYRGALEMRRALGERARMVTVDAGGHGAYLSNGNARGDRTVTEFLLTGRRPGTDVVCRDPGPEAG
ncbi:alpha/beta hydrolase [Streptomyces lycii]|uniref:Alpha/beta hydrolase n=1 Tax=Streptomyces lycii TaxID=2654337 RepID=A0ABQ7FDB2_9ACTN|nr:alpha/beta hydrolase [Streptomyces lycii]KAF4407056.1 alpha/beta hydrolase [Streptomyces lycii]